MADGDTDDTQAGNTFSNDGSFMEQFMKMQKEKEKSNEADSTLQKDSVTTASAKPLRKPPASLAQKMMKNRAAKKLAATGGGGKEGSGKGEGADNKKESGG